jgi:hypothetical protein
VVNGVIAFGSKNPFTKESQINLTLISFMSMTCPALSSFNDRVENIPFESEAEVILIVSVIGSEYSIIS